MQYYLHIISRVIHVLQALLFSGSHFSISCIPFVNPTKYALFSFIIQFIVHILCDILHDSLCIISYKL